MKINHIFAVLLSLLFAGFGFADEKKTTAYVVGMTGVT